MTRKCPRVVSSYFTVLKEGVHWGKGGRNIPRTVAHNCDDENYSRQKKDSWQKENPRGKKKKTHGKKKNLAAKRKTLAAKRKDSRQKEKHLQQKEKTHGKRINGKFVKHWVEFFEVQHGIIKCSKVASG